MPLGIGFEKLSFAVLVLILSNPTVFFITVCKSIHFKTTFVDELICAHGAEGTCQLISSYVPIVQSVSVKLNGKNSKVKRSGILKGPSDNVPKGSPLRVFLIFCNGMYGIKSRRVPLLHFSTLCDFFLSLKYGADFRRLKWK